MNIIRNYFFVTLNIFATVEMNWNLILIILIVGIAVLLAGCLVVKMVTGKFGGGYVSQDAMLAAMGRMGGGTGNGGNAGYSSDLSALMRGGAHISDNTMAAAMEGAADMPDWQGGNMYNIPDWQGGYGDDWVGGVPPKKNGEPVIRVDHVFGFSKDEKGDVSLYGQGRMSKREVNNLKVAGRFTLDAVKVKETLKVQGHVGAFNCSAKKVEISGSAYLENCNIDTLVVKNKKVADMRPNIVIVGGEVKNIEILDKTGKEAEFVVRRAKGERPLGK